MEEKIQTTKWLPDTCGCVIERNWFESNPDQMILKSIIKCEIHSNLEDEVALQKVLEENINKNKVISTLATEVKDIKPEEVNFSYNEDRKLTLEISSGKMTEIEAINFVSKTDGLDNITLK